MKLYPVDDIIAAIATPIGEGAISVIRVSGNKSIQLVDGVFQGKTTLKSAKTHTIHYGKIFDENHDLIDDVLISVYKAPHTYTGEESIEISTHGNPVITEKVIKVLIAKGARHSEPGEFTKRAFLNGRMDLVQAEAVCDIIRSRTDASLRGARNQMDGLLSSKVNLLRKKLIDIFSLLEIELDFSEEDLTFANRDDLKEKFDAFIKDIDYLLESFSFGKIIRDGVNVAIVGEPNVGKSSLLNYLLKESRAIVSAQPGTTRDVIQEELMLDGILFKLYDTAGIREAECHIEKEGVKRSEASIKNADIVVFLNDVKKGVSDSIQKSLTRLIDKNRILTVLNKIDLDSTFQMNGMIGLSAKTGEGIDRLFAALKKKVKDESYYTESTAVVSNARHYQNLKSAKEAIQRARETLLNETSELVVSDLRVAERALSEIIGETTSDDILNSIFANFCIGK